MSLPSASMHFMRPACGWVLGLVILFTGCAAPPEATPPSVPVAPAPPVHPLPVTQPSRAVPHRDRSGVGALHLVLEQMGRTCEVAHLTAEVAKLESSGMPHEEALAAHARRHGLWAHAQYGRLDRLADRVRAAMPVLVQLQDAERRADQRYFAVVDAYQVSNRILRLRTGDGLPLAISEGEFWRRWERVRFWMMTVGPPELGTWELSALEYVSRMQFLDAAGRFEEGDADAAKALLLEGNQADLCISVAVRERARGRAEAAEALFRRAMDKEGAYVRAANNLAYLLAEQGRDLEEAEQLARACVLREPTNPRVLDTLAFVLQVRGRWADALPLYERAHQRARHMVLPVRREIGLHLARAYLETGQPAEAARLARELLVMDPAILLPSDLSRLVP